MLENDCADELDKVLFSQVVQQLLLLSQDLSSSVPKYVYVTAL
jgi:hypothetical protein